MRALGDLVRPGDTVLVGTGVGEPVYLIEELIELSKKVGMLWVIQVMTGGRERLADASGENLRLLTPVPGRKSRAAIEEGRAELLDLSMGQLARGIAAGVVPVDGVLLLVAVRDGRARASLTGDLAQVAFERARFRAVEVSPKLPWVEGENLVELERCECVVTSGTEPAEVPTTSPSPEVERIAAYVAELVPDGATLELGVGRALMGVSRALSEHRHLAIHGGVVDDRVKDLVASGAVDRPADPNGDAWAVGAVAMGSRQFYEWLDGNRRVAVSGSQHVHDVAHLAGLPRFVAINSALEVDLLGQANLVGWRGRVAGGVGGAAEFAVAGACGAGSILALTSRAPDGRSGIVFSVARVSIPSYHVTHVVTEFGVAEVRTGSLSRRARELLKIAHPAERDRLAWEARRAGLI